MKAKNSYSKKTSTYYANTVIAVTGVVAVVASLTISWPALHHIGGKLIS